MRTYRLIRQATPEMIDQLYESVGADLVRKAIAARPAVKPQDWIVRQLLPWTDLRVVLAGQAGVNTDFWGTGALVASTPVTYVNRVLPDNQFVGILGFNVRDITPCAIKLLFQTGVGASTLANVNIEQIFGDAQAPEALFPEYLYYGGGSTVFIQVIPDAIGKAAGTDGVGDHIILLGLIAGPAGEILSF